MITPLGGAHSDEGPLASINIVPFVDIALVLLVIFMATSTAIARASLEVDLPKAATAGSRVDSTLNFVCLRDGTLLLDGQPLPSLSAAGGRVRDELRRNPRTRAVISADEGVDYGRVIELIDWVKAHGVHTFALDVERR